MFVVNFIIFEVFIFIIMVLCGLIIILLLVNWVGLVRGLFVNVKLIFGDVFFCEFVIVNIFIYFFIFFFYLFGVLNWIG